MSRPVRDASPAFDTRGWTALFLALIILSLSTGQLFPSLAVAQDANRSPAELFKYYISLAEHGDAAAQFIVGVMYVKGQGVQKNYQQAMRWFRMAARQGFEPAKQILTELGETP